MKALGWIFLSISCCAAMNVVVKYKLATSNPLISTTIQSAVIVILALLLISLSPIKQTATLPNAQEYIFLALCGLLALGATVGYFSAYNSGGSLFLITTASIFIPLLASLLDLVCGGPKPTGLQLTAWALAAGSVCILTYGTPK